MAARLGSFASLGRWHHLHASDPAQAHPVAEAHTDTGPQLASSADSALLLMAVHDCWINVAFVFGSCMSRKMQEHCQ